MTDTARSNYIAFIGRHSHHLLTDTAVKELWDMMQQQHDELSANAAERVDQSLVQTRPTALNVMSQFQARVTKTEAEGMK